jgi:capsular polysaccharide biosynthesis protein
MQDSDGFDLDLGKYIETLIRQWRLILAAVLVCAIAAAVVSLNQPASYESSVLVVSTKVGSVVTFGSEIETLSEGQGYTNFVDRKARLQTFVALVESPVIAERVYKELIAQLGVQTPKVETLLKMVSGSLVPGSDTIHILVRNSAPEITQAVANAWGKHYIDFINDTYSTGGTEDAASKIQVQIDQAYETYNSAQAEYIASLLTSPQGEITRMMEDMLRAERLLEEAQGLRAQVRAGDEETAASSAVAFSLLKAQVYAATPGMENVQIQIVPVEISAQAMLKDLENLVETLESRRQILVDRTAELLANINAGASPAGDVLAGTLVSDGSEDNSGSSENTRADTEQKLRLLQSQSEYETSLLHEKMLARDLAWQTYSNLTTKKAELAVAVQTGGQEVALGAPATMSTMANNALLPIVLAIGVGLLLGVLSAFALEGWWSYKGLPLQPVFLLRNQKRDG